MSFVEWNVVICLFDVTAILPNFPRLHPNSFTASSPQHCQQKRWRRTILFGRISARVSTTTLSCFESHTMSSRLKPHFATSWPHRTRKTTRCLYSIIGRCPDDRIAYSIVPESHRCSTTILPAHVLFLTRDFSQVSFVSHASASSNLSKTSKPRVLPTTSHVVCQIRHRSQLSWCCHWRCWQVEVLCNTSPSTLRCPTRLLVNVACSSTMRCALTMPENIFVARLPRTLLLWQSYTKECMGLITFTSTTFQFSFHCYHYLQPRLHRHCRRLSS